MKILAWYFALFFTLFLAQNEVLAQAPCGTEITTEQMEAFYQRNKSHLQHKGPKAMVYIPVTYHLVSDDNGIGAYTIGELFELHCSLVEDYADADITFYIHDIVYHESSYYYYMQNSQAGSTMFIQENIENTCNIFIVEDAKSGTTSVCGYSYLAQASGYYLNKNGIMLAKNCIQLGSTTLTHEMGHYLNLPHTFYGWEGRSYTLNPPAANEWERVDGSNCAFRGDGFCDTPPDYISERWNCFINPPYDDAVGQSFITDEKNFMSYSLDDCQQYLKPEQQAEVNAAPANYRPYLLTLPVPNLTAVAQANLIYPADGALGLDASNMFLSWEEIPGADYYLVQFTQSNFYNVENEKVVTTNFLNINDLFQNKSYKWRVKAFTYANVCSDFSSERIFNTNTNPVNIAATGILCAEDENGAAKITDGVTGVDFKWSIYDYTSSNFSFVASTAYDSINNLAPGFYEVQVTDSIGSRIVSFFNVANISEIEISIVETGGGIKAFVSGGNSPYIYTWSNGSSLSSIPNPVEGINVLYITDENTCFKSKEYNYVPKVEPEPIPQDSIVLNYFPNPVVGDYLYFNFSSKTDYIFSLKMFTISGEIVLDKQYNIIIGENKLEVDIQSLAKGIYYVEFPYGEEKIIKKIFI